MSRLAIVFATLGMVFPCQPAQAAGPMVQPPQSVAPQTMQVNDIELQEQGTLVGQVLDAQGLPRAGSRITLSQEETPVAAATTDSEGTFRLQGLRGGTYRVTVDGQEQELMRLWAPNTAPPIAQEQALFVSADPVIRGRLDFEPTTVSTLAILGVTSAAIMIPVGIHNHKGSSSSVELPPVSP